MVLAIVQTASNAQGAGTSLAQTPANVTWAGVGSTNAGTVNFGATSFAHTIPSGFTAWDNSGTTTWASPPAGITLSGGSLTATSTVSTWVTAHSSTSKTGGKWYWEITVTNLTGSFNNAIGLASTSMTTFTGNPPGFGGASTNAAVSWQTGQPGFLWNGSVTGQIAPGTYTTGDVLGFAVDLNRGMLWVRNGSGNWNNSASGDPTNGVYGFPLAFLVSTAPTGQAASCYNTAPTNGNLLLAFGYLRNGVTPTPINSWAQAASFVTTTNWNLICYYKYASSTPASEAIDTNSALGEWGCQFWEISGVTGTLASDVKAVHFGTQNGSAASLVVGSRVTGATTGLVLAGLAGQFGAATDTQNWPGAPWTFDSQFTSTVADGFSSFNWSTGGHQSVTGGATVTLTVTPSVSVTAWTGGYIELAAGTNTETGAVTMALTKVSFSASAGRTETGAVTLALAKVSFAGTGVVENIVGSVVFALHQIAMKVSSINLSTLAKLRQFATFN